MVNSVIPFPGQYAEASSEEEEIVRAATQDLLRAVAAQPVPDRLHALAAELGRALDMRGTELFAPDDETDRTA